MSKVKQYRHKMFTTRDFMQRLHLMYLIRGLQWQEREKLPRVMVAIESTDEAWYAN